MVGSPEETGPLLYFHPASADTCYWIALVKRRGQTHDIAIRFAKSLADYRIVATEEVLTELLITAAHAAVHS
jgi:predicted nucleic acid-binding protein